MKASAYAPGKIILIGEHFVVYGKPAIVMAINIGVKVIAEKRADCIVHISSNLGFFGKYKNQKFESESMELNSRKHLEPVKIASETVLKELDKRCGLNIEIHSDLPIAVGLGSSGALAVSTVAAIGKLLGANFSEKEIIKLSFEAEKYVHLHPSGIDQAVSTYGGVIVFDRNRGVSRLNIETGIPIVIGNTGIQRNTGMLVKSVRIKKDMFANVINSLIHTGGQLTSEAIDVLKKGNLKQFGELMDINHGLLTALGVSNDALDRLVNSAKKSGALGAKLTGAGGGGCMVALSTSDNRKKIANAIRLAGGTPILAEKTEVGVKTWLNH
ncbi:MAG: mevalonate kinase [Candidatus Bathyarchaeota archaeon]|nr:MAG: mevalonate kinase [Candidatus Bathyarchaeota archaeon]